MVLLWRNSGQQHAFVDCYESSLLASMNKSAMNSCTQTRKRLLGLFHQMADIQLYDIAILFVSSLALRELSDLASPHMSVNHRPLTPDSIAFSSPEWDLN